MEENNMSPTPQKGSNGTIIAVVIGLIVVGIIAFVAFGRGDSSDEAQTNTGTQPAGQTNNSTNNPAANTPAMDDSVKAFTVVGSNFAFSPSTITVKKGDKVRINFQSTGFNHDFVLDEFNVKTAVLTPGNSQTIEFTADKTGQFEYYCSVGTHRQMGMKGTLVVQ